jgi:hypothetical protein
MIKQIIKSILFLTIVSNQPTFGNCIPTQIYNYRIGNNVIAINSKNKTKQVQLPECQTRDYVCSDQHMATLMRQCCYKNQLNYVPYGNSTGFCD